MYTLEEITEKLFTDLKEEFTDLKIEFGKYEQLNLTAPAVYIYFEPYGAESTQAYLYYRYVRFTLFVTASTKNVHTSIIEATKTAEKIELWLAENFELNYDGIESPFSFDSFYSNIAVVGLQFNIFYKSSVQP